MKQIYQIGRVDRLKNLAWILCIAILIYGCQQDEKPVKVDLSKKEQIILSDERDVITYAYLPQYSHKVSYTRHHPLVMYLKTRTGLNIKQIFPDTFNQHMKMVDQKKIDISFSNPFIYVKIAHRYDARAFARVVEVLGKDRFRGQIICRKDNKQLKTIKDCRDKTWIAVDSSSAGGYLYPLGHFIDNGLRKDDFREIAFAPGPGGKQEKVILTVFAGKYDIGTIREGALTVASGIIDIGKLRILSVTDPYPGWVYAARNGLDQRIVDKIKEALIMLDFNNRSHREILERAHFVDVIEAADSDFDSIRQLSDKLGIKL
jgi:phosphonate transport system substrate-binding protein